MITIFELQDIIESQLLRLAKIDNGMERKFKSDITTSHALIISGIRRCGKSTLMRQLMHADKANKVFLNFEDPRLAAFTFSDFERLGKYAEEKHINHFYLDEIQNISGWENFVRFKLDEGYQVTITGSNASLLSVELGTKLTGRHITRELFPFSYAEYLQFTTQKEDAQSLQKYLHTGGFPEYILSENEEVLQHVFNDILLRDIAVRYQIKQTRIIRSLAVFILSNSGNRMSANALRKQFEIASSSSINEYLNYLQDSYLFLPVSKFSYSLKAQQVNPKKWYAIDSGLITVNAQSFTPDYGRLLETVVFLHLRRNFSEIYYFLEKKECDFVVFRNSKIIQTIQVCFELNSMNKEREIAGLVEAMDYFGQKEGWIVTFNQEDLVSLFDKTIHILPFWKWYENL